MATRRSILQLLSDRVAGVRQRPWLAACGALLVAYAHGLTLIALFASAAVAMLARASAAELGLRAWAANLRRGLVPLAPAACYALAVFLHHSQAPHIGWEPLREGEDLPAWKKLIDLPWLSQGNLADFSDTWLFSGLIVTLAALAAIAYVRGAESPYAPRECRALALFWLLAYLVVPQRVFSTGFVFERIPIWIWIFVLTCAPRVARGPSNLLRTLGVGLVLLSSLNTARAFHAIPGAAEASAAIDAIPPGARVLSLTYGARALPIMERPIWTHLSAYYFARKRGEIAYDFTRFASLPVRLRDPGARPSLPAGLEWNPKGFAPSEPYARYYDTLLVITNPDEPFDPSLVREPGEALVPLVERGRFQVYRRERPPDSTRHAR